MPRLPLARSSAPLLALAVALALLAACRESTGSGQCFEPNATPYRFDLGDTNIVFHWPSSYMPVRVYAEPVGNNQANTRQGMDLWVSAFRCHELSYTMVTDSTRADIIVRNPATLPLTPLRAAFEMHADSDSIGACHGVTQFSTDSDTTALLGPMRSYVAAFAGADSAAAASCFHFTIAHELGHALGLLSESPYPGDLMYAVPTRLALTESDRYSIQILYHIASKIGPPPRQ